MKEVAKDFELCEFGLDLVVKGFDPKGNLVSHLNSVKYSNLSVIFTPQEI